MHCRIVVITALLLMFESRLPSFSEPVPVFCARTSENVMRMGPPPVSETNVTMHAGTCGERTMEARVINLYRYKAGASVVPWMESETSVWVRVGDEGGEQCHARFFLDPGPEVRLGNIQVTMAAKEGFSICMAPEGFLLSFEAKDASPVRVSPDGTVRRWKAEEEDGVPPLFEPDATSSRSKASIPMFKDEPIFNNPSLFSWLWDHADTNEPEARSDDPVLEAWTAANSNAHTNLFLVLFHGKTETDRFVFNIRPDHSDIRLIGHRHSAPFPGDISVSPHRDSSLVLGYRLECRDENGSLLTVVEILADGRMNRFSAEDTKLWEEHDKQWLGELHEPVARHCRPTVSGWVLLDDEAGVCPLYH